MIPETNAPAPPALDTDRERKLADMGQMAAGVMHTVNNVLNSIMTMAYLVDANAADEKAVREYTERIVRAVNSGSEKLSPLVNFIRQDPLDERTTRAVDLLRVLDEVLGEFGPELDARDPAARIRIERDTPRSAVIQGIAAEVATAVREVVRNAIVSMPKGGVLSITLLVGEGDATIEVRDTGSGMTPNALARLFEPYAPQTSGRLGGLGLAAVYGIMKRHKGSAELASDLGRGTTVRLRFPTTGQ